MKNNSHLSIKLTTEKSRYTSKLKDKKRTEELKMLYNKFAVVPTDKTSDNVAFVCQRHHAQVVITELCLNNVSNITLIYIKAIKLVD